jgi:hypothetical protein
MTKLLTAEEELPFVISTAEQELISDFLEFYSKKKHDEKFTELNKHLLRECLSVRGYGNYNNQLESGEDFFIQEILAKSNPTLCIDVGANIGRYSASLLEKTNTRVIAFEPVPTTFIKLIEKKLNKKAIIKYLPLQKGDIKSTCANIINAKNKINYKPKTLIKTGVSRFIDWYRKYYNI